MIYTVLLLFKTSCFVKDIDIYSPVIYVFYIEDNHRNAYNIMLSNPDFHIPTSILPPTHSEHRALKNEFRWREGILALAQFDPLTT